MVRRVIAAEVRPAAVVLLFALEVADPRRRWPRGLPRREFGPRLLHGPNSIPNKSARATKTNSCDGLQAKEEGGAILSIIEFEVKSATSAVTGYSSRHGDNRMHGDLGARFGPRRHRHRHSSLFLRYFPCPLKPRSLGDVLQEFSQHRRLMQDELQKVIVGQDEVIEQIFAAIFTRGHCLLVGVPGLAKTLMVSTLARSWTSSSNASSSRPT